MQQNYEYLIISISVAPISNLADSKIHIIMADTDYRSNVCFTKISHIFWENLVFQHTISVYFYKNKVIMVCRTNRLVNQLNWPIADIEKCGR